MKLTDMVIKKAKPREKVYSLGDGNGLSLIVEPNGSKGWRFRYPFNGKSKMISLGIYPVITLNEAREKRDDAGRLVAYGTDPSEHHYFASSTT